MRSKKKTRMSKLIESRKRSFRFDLIQAGSQLQNRMVTNCDMWDRVKAEIGGQETKQVWGGERQRRASRGISSGKRRKEERFKVPLRQGSHLNLEVVTDQHFKVGELAGVGETLTVKKKL